MDGFIFYAEWIELIQSLPQEKQMSALKAISDYCLLDTMPDKEDTMIYLIILAIKPFIDEKKRIADEGKKGGRPKKPVEKTQKTPVFNSETPVIEEKTPVIEEKTPVFNSKTPVIEKKTPVFFEKPGFSECSAEKEKESSPHTPFKEKEKEKENINYVDTKESEKERFSPSSSTVFPVSDIEDVLMSEEMWVESMLYKYRLDKEQLAVQVHGFVREWIERGDNHKTLKDAKRHADALLRIRNDTGTLAAAPHWNRFLAERMMPYVDELGYTMPLIAAFGKYYNQDVGNGKPFFLGLPKFEEEIRERMRQFKEEFKPDNEDEQPDESRRRVDTA